MLTNRSHANELGDYRFAHNEQVLKQRQRKYVAYFSSATRRPQPDAPILDLGCGRGFFLDLLAREKLPALGVDAFPDAIAECARRGHANCRVVEALEYLESDPSPLAGIFCSHLIEHFAPAEVRRLLRAMQRRLLPGGRLVLITPNPVNLHVLGETFYLDQSHVRPYPLKLLAQLCREAGFAIIDQGWDADTAPRHPWYKWPLHAARALILGRYYRSGEDSFIVAEKPDNPPLSTH